MSINKQAAIEALKALQAALAGIGTDAKAGARHNKNDSANVQSMHDLAVKLGAACPGGKAIDAKAIPADMDPGWYAISEGWDVSTAAGVLSQVASLAQSEVSQADGAGVGALLGIMRSLLKFIAGEIGGMQEGAAADTAEPEALPTTSDAMSDDLPEPGDMVITPISEIKAVGDGWELDVLGVPFGGPNGGKDTHGEFFSSRSKTYQDQFPEPLVVYYHGYTPDGHPMGDPEIIGKSRYTRSDAKGHWYRVVLDKAKAGALRVRDAAMKNMARASSGTVRHLARVARNGEILNWPVFELSLFDTAGKRQPANAYAVAVPALKSLYQRAGISLPEPITDGNAKPEADARGATSPASAAPSRAADSQPSNTDAKGTIDMTPEELLALLDKRDADKRAAEERAAAEVTARQEAIKAAVADERTKWERDAAKGRRLPLGEGAPHIARFGDTRKYDALNAADTAFLVAVVGAGRHAPSQGSMKALAIKVQEEKSAIGEIGRSTAKALGFDLEDATDAAKANELDYSTQAGFGDEFVPTIWGSNAWQQVRAVRAIVAKLPSKEFTGPGDTYTLPIEGADPTWYKIGQATDLNGTTGRPDATVGDSKIATANKNLSFAKMGTRVPWSGEFGEDSIIDWVPQVRYQTEQSFGEQFEHAIIDGDTATGATTNINHIGGTPTSTGTKQDLFLLVDGFRKSPLVTTTANSLNANGVLVDTNILTMLQLMGAAGLYADPSKTSLIIDANVYWKIQQLVSVKTRDVFLNATLENGMLNRLWNYEVLASWFMHWRSTTNPRKANTAGKVDLTTQANNTTGSILGVRWDQWLLAIKRAMTLKLQDIPDSDAQQMIATARFGLTQRDTEASVILYNVGV